MNLKALNSEQKKAVQFDEGSSLIVAGAGSGKTKVLTYKIAYLISKGYAPESILALTFTNKAANEMKLRIKDLIGSPADDLWMGTFHSIFAKILRAEAEHLGFTKNFSIYDAEDSGTLITNVITDLGINSEQLSPRLVRRRISLNKNLMIMPEEYGQKYINSANDEKFVLMYTEYQRRLKANNAMDFEDLLLQPIQLFTENKKVHSKYKKLFSYLLIDEFQDTNKPQFEIAKILTPREDKIIAVGDDAQSIYSWRGADLTNMLSFEKVFPKCKVFRLEQNYRSTKNILAAADCVIRNNKDQIAKKLWTDNEKGEQVCLIKASDEKDEAYQIAQLLKDEVHKNKYALKDIGILYRTNAQSRSFEDVFTRERIPYVIIGGIEFYKRKEVRDIISYLRILVNPADEESLLRIMNFPQRGIGMTTIRRMLNFARKHEITLFETLSRVFEVIDIKERIQKNVKQFKQILDKYILLKERLSFSEMSRALVDELGIIREFKEDSSYESLQRLENVEELLSSITQFGEANPQAKVEDFLNDIALITDHEFVDGEKNVVNLMSVHAAKGLEFPVVFLTGCEEDVFPLAQKYSSEARIEEERRLFYVGITRAKRKAFISHARSRYRFGEVAYQGRSRFIDEIDQDMLLEVDGNAGRKNNRKSKKEMYYEYFENVAYTDFSQTDIMLRVGSRVMHEKFGLGKVIQVIGAGDGQKVTVTFEGNNLKQLMLKFAKLKVLN